MNFRQGLHRLGVFVGVLAGLSIAIAFVVNVWDEVDSLTVFFLAVAFACVFGALSFGAVRLLFWGVDWVLAGFLDESRVGTTRGEGSR
jgi:hypothetical protein